MSETGHAKNVANFETTHIILTGLGAGYNTNQPLILLPAVKAKLNAAKSALAAVDAAEAAKKIDVNDRQTEFDGIEKLAVNIKRSVEVEINDETFTRDVLAIIRKFRGGGNGTETPDDPNTLNIDESKPAKSTSQRSYDNLVSHFADLIALLQTQPAYNPSDPEMQIAALETKLAAMQAKNNAAKTSTAALGNAQDTRDEILYDPETGVLKLVKLIKTQLALNPGKDSAAYQQINALEFRK